ncbi:hypothetical protein Tco_0923297 [Tanacetum coccineum]|uniref:Uncharacterized protein n=1 Tax=Tanacetum coccineum TaxID=301880 RepID=A0ABQ5D3X0_9ASTR
MNTAGALVSPKGITRFEKKLVHLEQPLQPALDPATTTQEAIDAYYELVSAQQEVACLMLASMSPDL